MILQMDQEGWIEIAVIAAFKRLATLTSDVNLVKEMMRLSCMTEIRENKVRTVDWQNWVLPTAKPASWQDAKSTVEPSYQPPQMMGMQYQYQGGYDQTPMQQFALPLPAQSEQPQAAAGSEKASFSQPAEQQAGQSEPSRLATATQNGT